MDNKQWIVYLIRCSDESLYCGITNNLTNRLAAHNLGRGAKYTRSRRPIELVGSSSEMTKNNALKLEYRIKQIPAGKKIFELIKGEDKMTMNLKKDLQAVNKELKALATKFDKLIVAVEKLEKPKTKTEKKKPEKKEVATKSVPKKEVQLTAIDTVLGFIKRSKKGIDTAALIKKTGFSEKKIHNIVYKLKKQGKAKSEGKGVYVKA
ncbi:MAG: GIY-YIG nuclease family protein [Proteobacteria bacterium]|nr:GIY-YIG nuclease family protein [Pseudomonadota bacterium]